MLEPTQAMYAEEESPAMAPAAESAISPSTSPSAVLLLWLPENGSYSHFPTLERIAQGEVKIGKHPANDIIVHSANVSRNHCTVFLAGDILTVVDLGSSNGTWLGAQMPTEAAEPVRCTPHTPYIFSYGESFCIGDVKVQFQPADYTATGLQATLPQQEDPSALTEHMTSPGFPMLPPATREYASDEDMLGPDEERSAETKPAMGEEEPEPAEKTAGTAADKGREEEASPSRAAKKKRSKTGPASSKKAKSTAVSDVAAEADQPPSKKRAKPISDPIKAADEVTTVLAKPVSKSTWTSEAPEPSRPSVRLAFTGIIPSAVELEAARTLKAQVLGEGCSVLDATHVVTPKGQIRRTAKLLTALCAYGPSAPRVVHVGWLQAGGPAECQAFAPFAEGYETHRGCFSMASTLSHRDRAAHGLFMDRTVLVAHKAKPPLDVVKQMVECAGGIALEATKAAIEAVVTPSKAIVLASEEDVPDLKTLCKKRKLTLVKGEWLSQGLVDLDFERYDLVLSKGSWKGVAL